MVLGTILGIFGLRSSSDTDGAEAIKEALKEPRKEVDLHGVFEEPELDRQGANTAVVPVTLYDADTGLPYGETAVEFAIETDRGKRRLESFLDAHGIDGPEALEDIEGRSAEVTRQPSGNIKVNY